MKMMTSTLLLVSALLCATAEAKPRITGGNLPPLERPRIISGPLPPEVITPIPKCRVLYARICWIR